MHMQPLWRRPVLHVETLLMLGIFYLVLACNGPFWHAALAGRAWATPATWGFAAALLVLLAAVHMGLLGLLATRHTVKPLLTVLVLAAAAASYYMDRYAIYFDRAMLRNVLATNPQEARELMGWGVAAHLQLYGLLPAALVWWPRLERRPPVRAGAVRLAWVAGAAVVALGSLWPVMADMASLMRNHKEVRHLITPGNLLAAGMGNSLSRARHTGAAKLPVGADAALGAAWQARTRPVLFVLVVGETARAQNFSLNGYGRETNPALARRGVINFPQATACGTSTEVSLPCMFSPFGRARYDEEKILSHESLLHVLARAGFKVSWRDNQSGCKGVCSGLPAEQLDRAGIESLCAEGQCLDEVLLEGMDRVLRDTRGNLFVVMHQLGSHGPAYFKRYPAAFARFTPACEKEDLHRCSTAEIVNAYDNSLLYTDHFLSRMIDFLDRAQATHDTAMLYVSDHGESLGESGLYLHGMPRAIAPDVQTHVPLLTWLSPAFNRSFGVDADCLRGRARHPASHDNLFHSVLGLLDVQTQARDSAQDLFAPCRPATGITAASRLESRH